MNKCTCKHDFKINTIQIMGNKEKVEQGQLCLVTARNDFMQHSQTGEKEHQTLLHVVKQKVLKCWPTTRGVGNVLDPLPSAKYVE